MTGAERTGVPEPRLYAVPFDRVWRAAEALLAPERGWTVLTADARAGLICVERRRLLLRTKLRLRLAVSLDELGLTRVDATFLARDGTGPLIGQRRRIEGLLRRLERALADGERAPTRHAGL